DPALEITATQSQVIQLVVRAFVPSGVDQSFRVYRNSREDVLITANATVGSMLARAIVLDALAGDRFLVAVAPNAKGASDVGLQVFAAPTGARFPSACQIAASFSAVTGNTVDNLCGSPITHNTFGNVDDSDVPSAPVLATGPYAELGNAADLTANLTAGTYFK